MLGVSTATLQFWENAFPQLEPERTKFDQRRYSEEDVEICKLIMYLFRKNGYSL